MLTKVQLICRLGADPEICNLNDGAKASGPARSSPGQALAF